MEPMRRQRQRLTVSPGFAGGFERLERVKGIEPSYSAWKAAALPLSYTRDFNDLALFGVVIFPILSPPRDFSLSRAASLYRNLEKRSRPLCGASGPGSRPTPTSMSPFCTDCLAASRACSMSSTVIS